MSGQLDDEPASRNNVFGPHQERQEELLESCGGFKAE
jgi:hypothetical protein